MRTVSRLERGAPRTSLGRAFALRMDVLRDDTGSVTEAVVATTLSLLILSIIAAGSISSLSALTTSSSNAERIQQMNVMTGKPATVDPAWAAATDAAIEAPIILPSGVEMTAYLWSVPGDPELGDEYFAAMPRSGNVDDEATCADIVNVHTGLCVYASSFQATDVRATMPFLLGTNVADTTTFPANTTIASVPAPTTTEGIRFYLEAAAVSAPGTIDIVQGSKVIARIDLGTDTKIHFGTFAPVAGVEIRAFSPDRTIIVNEFFLYNGKAAA